jgi:hypothetical protein
LEIKENDVPQKTDFPYAIEIYKGADFISEKYNRAFPCYVEIEPDDGTFYSFIIFPSDKPHGYDSSDLPVVAVASVEGPAFPGQWVPICRVMEWWKDTKDQSRVESVEHIYIKTMQGDSINKKVNPFTIRSVFLAILKTMGVI